MGMGMLHSVPKMLRTCSRVVGVFGDMFLHSVPKKGVFGDLSSILRAVIHRKKESPGMRIFQESVPNMRIPGDILII